MSQTLNTAATALLAERDGLHPAHAANRLALAIRVADAAVELDASDWYASRIERGTHRDAANLLTHALSGALFAKVTRWRISRDAKATTEYVSDDTLRLALMIVEAGQ
jgi:hypothetical protein